eukprot:augustus_masked-scaffold_4-processed-gene-3.53-mRNA-1 protein AED:1.00 eAED:1.00 QI:0/0/0/0/1/1/2/0/621
MADSLVVHYKGEEVDRFNSKVFLHSESKYIIFFNTEHKSAEFNLQANKDVFSEVDMEEAINRIVKDLMSPHDYVIENIKGFQREVERSITLGKVEYIKAESVTSSHFKRIGPDIDSSEVTPILLSNMLENVPDTFEEVEIGKENIKEDEEEVLIKEMTKKKLCQAVVSDKEADVLEKLILQNREAWGLKQTNAQMSSLTPIEVSLIKDHQVLRSDGYHQPPEAEDFLELKLAALRKAGIVERSSNPIWGHPVFVVPKKLSVPKDWNLFTTEQKKKWKDDNILNRFRIVANMIRLNQITVKTSLNLPNLERQLLGLKGSRFFITLDVLSGFDFLPTHDKYKDIFTLVTRRLAYRMNGAPMGWCNTPALFADRIVNQIVDEEEPRYFCKQTTGIAAWLDDLLLYSDTIEALYSMLENILKRAARRRVRFNLRKCTLLEKPTIWCGREISKKGWNFDLGFFQEILDMAKPVYRHEVVQLVFMSNCNVEADEKELLSWMLEDDMLEVEKEIDFEKGSFEEVDVADFIHFSEEELYSLKRGIKLSTLISIEDHGPSVDLSYIDGDINKYLRSPAVETQVDLDIKSAYAKLLKEHISFLSPFYDNAPWDLIKDISLLEEQKKMDKKY